MGDSHADLRESLAKELKNYEVKLKKQNEVGARTGNSSVGNPKGRKRNVLGSRGEQYALLRKLYTKIISEEYFAMAKEGELRNARNKFVRKRSEISSIVRDAFKLHCKKDARAKRQKGHVWGRVLALAWFNSWEPGNFRSKILDLGGIEKAYRSI